MDKMCREVCLDCLNHRKEQDRVVCKYTDKEELFDPPCKMFRANHNELNRYIAVYREHQQRLRRRAMAWLYGCGGAALLLLLAGGAVSVAFELYFIIYILIALAAGLVAYSIRRYMALDAECHQMDIIIASRVNSYNNKLAEVIPGEHDPVEVDDIFKYLQRLGYAPDREGTMISFLHGDYLVGVNLVDAALCMGIYISAASMADVDKRLFLLAANKLVDEMVFVRVGYNNDGFKFELYTLLTNVKDMRLYLKDLILILERALQRHVEIYQSLLRDEEAENYMTIVNESRVS